MQNDDFIRLTTMSNITKSYNDFAVTFEELNGEVWFNATQAANRYSKNVEEWLKMPATKSYLDAFAKYHDRTPESLVATIGGEVWMLRSLFFQIVRWLDVDLAIDFDQLLLQNL